LVQCWILAGEKWRVESCSCGWKVATVVHIFCLLSITLGTHEWSRVHASFSPPPISSIRMLQGYMHHFHLLLFLQFECFMTLYNGTEGVLQLTAMKLLNLKGTSRKL
jgi:hypothetical protein